MLLAFVKTGLSRGAVKKLIERQWNSLHGNAPVDITYHGLRFRLHPHDNAIESKMLLGSKFREREELDALREVATPGSVFVDIGANIGYYTLMASRLGFERVIAVEPNPITFSRLQYNVTLNRGPAETTTHPVALGDSNGEVMLRVAEGDIGGSSVGAADDASRSVSVKMETLSALLDRLQIGRVDALKIDVEGLEDRVLLPYFRSSERSAWPRLIVIEPTSRGSWKEDIHDWLLTSGYRVARQTRSNDILELRR